MKWAIFYIHLIAMHLGRFDSRKQVVFSSYVLKFLASVTVLITQ